MRIHVNPARNASGGVSRELLPEQSGNRRRGSAYRRNTIKAFDVGANGSWSLFSPPGTCSFQAFIYTFFRAEQRPAAPMNTRRVRLRACWASTRPNPSHGANTAGLLRDTATPRFALPDYTSLSQTTEHFPWAGTLPVLEAFARFAVLAPRAGKSKIATSTTAIVLWRRDTATGTICFQLIDINCM